MFDLGIATSVAKNHNYSWKFTSETAKSVNLRTIQFYLPENCKIPIIDNYEYFDNIYLHLPNDYIHNAKRYLLAARSFSENYHSNNLVIHQNESLLHKDFLDSISIYIQNGFRVGIENEASTNLYSYLDLIEYLIQNKVKIFSVLDFHRFFNNFYDQYNSELILDMIFRFLAFYVNSDLKIVMHLIDSKSFSSDRRFWTKILNGILPYREIFSYILKKQIKVESIILEYETTELVKESIPILRKSLLFFGRN